MQRITWYALPAVVALVAPIGGQTGPPQAPQAVVREIARLPGVHVGGAARLPGGRIIIYFDADDHIVAYDLSTNRGTTIATRFCGEFSVTRDGDRLAFSQNSEDGKTCFVVSVPIDPKTGLPLGAIQRVSLTPGDSPSFSPDGKLIAFARYKQRGNDLAVVPATGGPERLIASYDWGIRTSWSDDGQFIFAYRVGTAPSRSVERVPLSGGAAEPVYSSGRVEGTIDGQIVFYPPDPLGREEGRLAYVTKGGVVGAITVPPGSGNLHIVSAQTIFPQTITPTRTRLVTIADGTSRDFRPDVSMSRAAQWSPDGRRVLLQESTGGPFSIVVMNADGSGRRSYAVRAPNTRHMRWSPDGRTIAFYQGTDVSKIAVLDLATGQSRVVTSAPAGRWHQDFIWKSDSRAIVFVRSSPSGDPRCEIYEVGFDGVERKLRDIGAEHPTFGPGGFISDQLMAAGTFTEQVLFSTVGAADVRLPAGNRRAWPAVMPDGKTMVWLVQSANGVAVTSVQVITTSGQLVRTLALPYTVDQTFLTSHPLSDGRNVIQIGKAAGETASRIYVVPLDGSAPRSLSQTGGRVTSVFSSRDGRSIVFDVDGAPTTTLYELDVSAIVKAAGSR